MIKAGEQRPKGVIFTLTLGYEMPVKAVLHFGGGRKD